MQQQHTCICTVRTAVHVCKDMVEISIEESFLRILNLLAKFLRIIIFYARVPGANPPHPTSLKHFPDMLCACVCIHTLEPGLHQSPWWVGRVEADSVKGSKVVVPHWLQSSSLSPHQQLGVVSPSRMASHTPSGPEEIDVGNQCSRCVSNITLLWFTKSNANALSSNVC